MIPDISSASETLESLFSSNWIIHTEALKSNTEISIFLPLGFY